jgi:hypothetical protein
MTMNVLELRYLIRSAMTNKQLVDFFYEGQYVLGEPQIYGIMVNEIHLLIYQLSGQNNSEYLPKWRDTRAENISNLRLLRYHFQGRRVNWIKSHDKFDKVLESVK